MDWAEGRPTPRSVGTKRPKRWPMLDSEPCRRRCDAGRGRRDRLALERLGFYGPVEVLNRGWPVDDVLVHLVETYGRRSEEDGGPSIIVFMDWDRTGGRLQANIRRNLESLDVRFDERFAPR